MKTSSFFLCLLFLFTSPLFGQNVDVEKIDAYLQKTYEEWELPGMALGIVKDGELIFSKGYGTITEGTAQTPNKHTNYAIASNSKAFTTTVIAMLVEEGMLDWDDPVQDYLPYFEIYDSYLSKLVTIEDLLTHRVGLGTFSGDVMWYDSNLTTEEVVRRAKYIPQAFSFRDGFGYSNVMYVTAGAVIEKVTGKTWGENVKERILEPLNMNRTVSQLSDLGKLSNVATPHATVNGDNQIIRWENWDQVASTGGLMSNIDDLAKWLDFQMSNGIVAGDTLLTEASRNRLWSIHNSFPVNDQMKADEMLADFRGYGSGYVLSEYKNHFHVSHTGGFGGMLTEISMLPNERLGIIFLSNDTESPLRSVSRFVMDQFIDPDDDTDHTTEHRQRFLEWKNGDTRVSDLKQKRIKNSKPSFSLAQYAGDYYSDLYGGNLMVNQEDGKLKLYFEHQPNLTATLHHWHYDTFEVRWDQTQPWFNFGLVQFLTNTEHEITGLEFNIPNDDFFFEELKPYRVK